MSPLVLFAAYAAQARLGKAPPLTAAKAFTSLALINLMIAPATQLTQGITYFLSASACLDRIQKFLLKNKIDEREEPRQRLDETKVSAMIASHQAVLDLPCDNEANPIDLELSTSQ
jgi:hypothetical protein